MPGPHNFRGEAKFYQEGVIRVSCTTDWRCLQPNDVKFRSKKSINLLSYDKGCIAPSFTQLLTTMHLARGRARGVQGMVHPPTHVQISKFYFKPAELGTRARSEKF